MEIKRAWELYIQKLKGTAKNPNRLNNNPTPIKYIIVNYIQKDMVLNCSESIGL